MFPIFLKEGYFMGKDSKMIVVLGRIHWRSLFEPKLSDDEFFHRVLDFLNKCPEYREEKGDNTFVWAFGNILTLKIDDDQIIYGRLGKIKEGSERLVYDREERKFKKVKDSRITNALAFVSFVIYPKHHLIAFQEKGRYISYKRFCEVFKKMSREYFDNGEFVITPLPDKDRVLQSLQEFKKIITVNFTVTLPNPVDEPEWKQFRKLLKGASVEKAKMVLTNEHQGLNPNSTIIKGGIHLAASGYGSARIEGETETGERKVIYTKDTKYRRVVKAPEDADETIAFKFFREIIKKFILKNRETSGDESGGQEEMR
ncbi:DUF4747 family protein [Thermococcus sp. GR4]|uniref:DUF4747 family protein n=1 Tax=Thermococcus sp. GR4 TaxID=1638254 RepID=UPI00142FB6CA|nr:DUF4747 family protein [Thermococcus sp. GR4]NJE79426.1 DUF4747 family protein [Thermococcus sp. GR4]